MAPSSTIGAIMPESLSFNPELQSRPLVERERPLKPPYSPNQQRSTLSLERMRHPVWLSDLQFDHAAQRPGAGRRASGLGL